MAKRLPFSEQLRRAIESSELTRYRIWKESGVAQSTLSEFVHGNRTLSMKNIDAVCEVLGLSLTESKKTTRKKR